MVPSSTPLDAFRDCGAFAFLCLLIAAAGMTAAFVGVVLLLTKARRAAWIPGIIAVLAGFGAIGAGVLGRQLGMARVEAAVATPGLEERDIRMLRAEGEKEANQCVKIGFATGSLPFLLGGVAVAVGLVVRKKSDA